MAKAMNKNNGMGQKRYDNVTRSCFHAHELGFVIFSGCSFTWPYVARLST